MKKFGEIVVGIIAIGLASMSLGYGIAWGVLKAMQNYGVL